MKQCMKLFFLVLLIGVTLSVPSRVSASSDEYTCSWSQYSNCADNLSEWMGQCTLGCTEDAGGGSYVPYCYSTTYWVQVSTTIDNITYYYLVPSVYTDCGSIPQGGQSCISGCMSQYNSQAASCVEQFCTEVQ